MSEWGIIEIEDSGVDVQWFGTAPDRDAAIQKYCKLAAEREDAPISQLQEQIEDLMQWVEETPTSMTWTSDTWMLVIFQISGEVAERPLG